MASLSNGKPAATPVFLADIGRSLPEDEQCDLGLSRLGGHPVWVDFPSAHNFGAVVQNPDFLKCDKCGQARTFIGQIFAGHEGAPCRILYLFACVAACGADSRAWRVVRSMGLPRTTKDRGLSSDSCDAGDDTVDPSVALGGGGGDRQAAGVSSSDDWGASGGDDWGATSLGGDDWGGGGFASTSGTDDLDALLASRDDASKAKSNASSNKAASGYASAKFTAKATDENKDKDEWIGFRESLNNQTPWPCFTLVIYDEPPAPPKSGAHELELLERYRQSELAGEDDCGSLPAQGDASAAPDDGSDDDGAYKDTERFMKFQRRLERSPDQVLRYSWGGKPLWISEPPEEVSNPAWPPPCRRCGAKRVFEAQLMPTLLFQLRRWCPERVGDGEIEWGSVLLYTCSADCAGEELCEEVILVQPAV